MTEPFDAESTKDQASSALPRTLVVSEAPFGLGNGFGVTLSTFFTGWPRERLRQLYTRSIDAPSMALSDHIDFADVPGPQGRRHALGILLARRPAWRRFRSGRWLTRTLDGWKPEIVYALVYSNETLAFADWCATRLQCPLVAHVADDGLETLSCGTTRKARDILTSAVGRLSISEEMRTEYLARYGLDSEVLHNGAADTLFESTPPAGARPFTVRYLGSVLPSHHYEAIEDIVAAVRWLAASGRSIQFEFCGGEWTRAHVEPLLDGQTVVHRGAVSQQQGHDLLKTADLLTVPVTFAAEAFSHVRLSLPTKLTECLASGSPTLVYGPAGTAPVEFCRRHGVGATIDQRSVDRLVAWIGNLMDHPRPALDRAARDRLFVQERYSASAIARQFRSSLRSAMASA